MGWNLKLKIWNRKDFYAGLLFLFFGVVAILEARNYAMGTAARMGAGYFPYILAIKPQKSSGFSIISRGPGKIP